VPGTFHAVAVKKAFSKRAAGMRTAVVEGVDRAADVEEGDTDLAGFDRQALAGRQIGEFTDGDTLGHGPSKPRRILR